MNTIEEFLYYAPEPSMRRELVEALDRSDPRQGDEARQYDMFDLSIHHAERTVTIAYVAPEMGQTMTVPFSTFSAALSRVATEDPTAGADGFELGMFVSYGDCGEAWVRAPDGSFATLIWLSGEPAYFDVSTQPDEQRWGTYAVQLPLPLTNDTEAAAYLAALLPQLRERWEAWINTH